MPNGLYVGCSYIRFLYRIQVKCLGMCERVVQGLQGQCIQNWCPLHLIFKQVVQHIFAYIKQVVKKNYPSTSYKVPLPYQEEITVNIPGFLSEWGLLWGGIILWYSQCLQVPMRKIVRKVSRQFCISCSKHLLSVRVKMEEEGICIYLADFHNIWLTFFDLQMQILLPIQTLFLLTYAVYLNILF